MKSIIIYDSVHGSTEKCAIILGTLLNAEIEIKKLQNYEEISIDEYNIVIIGGSIHHGVIQSRIEKFIQKNQSQLMGKKTGLYLCCMEEGEIARQQFAKAYPSDLRKEAVAAGLFGGEFDLDKMSIFEKKLTRKLTGIMRSVSKINEDEIRKFAEKLNQVIGEWVNDPPSPHKAASVDKK